MLQTCENCKGTGKVVVPTAANYPRVFWCAYCGGWGCKIVEAPHA
jgi:DnaJ-class molecular chaperone